MKIYTSNEKWGHCCCKSRWFESQGDGTWRLIGPQRLAELRKAALRAPRKPGTRRRETSSTSGLYIAPELRTFDTRVYRVGEPIHLVDRSGEEESYRPGTETRLQREARLRDEVARRRLGNLAAVERAARMMDEMIVRRTDGETVGGAGAGPGAPVRGELERHTDAA